jgi:hypothetical protein
MLTRRQRFWIGGITLFALALGLISFSLSGGEREPVYEGDCSFAALRSFAVIILGCGASRARFFCGYRLWLRLRRAV